jgi:CRISPR/Cas system endoribonuclease Cas6 (RAMP superfamily)
MGFFGVHFLTNPLQNRTNNTAIPVTEPTQKKRSACPIPNPLLFVCFQRYCNIVDIVLLQDNNIFALIVVVKPDYKLRSDSRGNLNAALDRRTPASIVIPFALTSHLF